MRDELRGPSAGSGGFFMELLSIAARAKDFIPSKKSLFAKQPANMSGVTFSVPSSSSFKQNQRHERKTSRRRKMKPGAR